MAFRGLCSTTEVQVFRDDGVEGATAQGTGSGEREAQALVGRGRTGQSGAKGSTQAKVVNP